MMERLKGKRTIDVHRLLIWTYQDQKAGAIVGAGVGLLSTEALLDGARGGYLESGRDSVVVVGRNARLGCFIDGGGPSRGDLHPDAEAVQDLVASLPAEDRRLVLISGVTGLMPDWKPEGVRIIPKLNYNGRPMMEYSATRKPVLCVLRIHNPPEVLEAARERYRAWWLALVRIAGDLSAPGCLIDHDVTGPQAPQNPWISAPLVTND